MDINQLNNYNQDTILNSNLNNVYSQKIKLTPINSNPYLSKNELVNFKSIKVKQLYLALINILGLVILKKVLYDN
tara:strand:- start:193 stop:417 length:225 start_codon:yes stop_codon:yes gene_type:complete